MSIDKQRSDATLASSLSENVMETMIVQEAGGTYHVSLPKGVVRDLGLEKGERVLICGQEGSDSLNLKPSSAVFADD